MLLAAVVYAREVIPFASCLSSVFASADRFAWPSPALLLFLSETRAAPAFASSCAACCEVATKFDTSRFNSVSESLIAMARFAAVIAYFSPSWTALQAERGRHFSVIVDGISN